MNFHLNNKIALVTGASRGIGKAIALILAQSGASVVVNYHQNQVEAAKVLAQIEDLGSQGIICQADVRDRNAVDKMISDTHDKLGQIDILVNNANIDFPVKPFSELSWTELENKVTGEMKALFNCSQAVLKDMTQQRKGKIILISSGLSRHPGIGFSAHAAAKSAMDGIAKVMAMELGPLGITVNVVAPGLVLTEATANMPAEGLKKIANLAPLRKLAEPEDIAGLVNFLASDMSNHITGQYIPVNGGNFMI